MCASSHRWNHACCCFPGTRIFTLFNFSKQIWQTNRNLNVVSCQLRIWDMYFDSKFSAHSFRWCKSPALHIHVPPIAPLHVRWDSRTDFHTTCFWPTCCITIWCWAFSCFESQSMPIFDLPASSLAVACSGNCSLLDSDRTVTFCSDVLRFIRRILWTSDRWSADFVTFSCQRRCVPAHSLAQPSVHGSQRLESLPSAPVWKKFVRSASAEAFGCIHVFACQWFRCFIFQRNPRWRRIAKRLNPSRSKTNKLCGRRVKAGETEV